MDNANSDKDRVKDRQRQRRGQRLQCRIERASAVITIALSHCPSLCRPVRDKNSPLRSQQEALGAAKWPARPPHAPTVCGIACCLLLGLARFTTPCHLVRGDGLGWGWGWGGEARELA